MTTSNSQSCETLWSLVGTTGCPVIVDARTDDDFDADPRLVPTAIRRPGLEAADWADSFPGRSVVVYCDGGLKISQATAAWLRQAGAGASYLKGGFQAWRAAGLPLVPEAKLPSRDGNGRTVWVTHERPEIDGLACSWLIRCFVDPAALFLFVESTQVHRVAERYPGVTPFGVVDVFWGRRDDRSTFETMLAELGLATEPMKRLAGIVRGADTAQPDLAPEVAGLLAVSRGLSASAADDLQMVAQGAMVYDALYRWACAVEEEPCVEPAGRAVA